MDPKGFTLLEILIAIILMGLLAGIAVVNFSGMTQNFELETATEQLIQALNSARTEAVARDKAVELADLGGGSYAIRQVDNGATLRGDISFGLQAGATSLAFTHLTGSAVAFDKWGRVGNASGGTPAITLTKGSLSKTVTIETATGYIHQ